MINAIIKTIAAAIVMSAAVAATTIAAGQIEFAPVVEQPEPNIVTEVRNGQIAPTDDDVDYILRVLTAEAGGDYVLAGCTAHALYNACEKHDWEHTPVEIMWKYGYTGPAGWISDAAEKAWDDVFCSGVRYTDIGDAIYFYAPQYCDSPWHESQRFVAEVSGVRFFEDWSS